MYAHRIKPKYKMIILIYCAETTIPTETTASFRRESRMKPHKTDSIRFMGTPDFISFSNRGILNPLLPFGLSSPLLNNEYCVPFLRVSPATVPPERAPTVAGGHLRRSGTSASDAPPLRRRNVMPLAMRPLREQTAHCRRTSVLARGTHPVAACCGSHSE